MKKQIFACIDDSVSARAVCDWTAWLSLRWDLPVTLLHVLEKPVHAHENDLSGAIGLGSQEALLKQMTELDAERSRLALEHGKLLLAEASQNVGAKSKAVINLLQKHGNLVETLIDLEPEIELLVMGRRGESSDHPGFQLGSHLESAIRATHRPVLVSLPVFENPKGVVIAYDGSEGSQKSVEFVLSYVPLFKDIPVHLLWVSESKPIGLDQEKSRLELAGLSVKSSQKHGDFDVAANDYVSENSIGLVIMGAYRHSAFRRFFVGSNTTKMLQKTKVPLLLVR